jgi:hypothetical protein
MILFRKAGVGFFSLMELELELEFSPALLSRRFEAG